MSACFSNVPSAWCSRTSCALALVLPLVSCGKRTSPDAVPNQPTTASFVTHGCEVRAALAPDKPRFMLGEPVFATFRVTTDCIEKLSIATLAIGGPFGRNDAFTLSAVASSGESLESIPTPRGEYGASSSHATLTKDEPFVARLLIAHWLTFPAPGRFEVVLNHPLDVGAVFADASDEARQAVKVAAPVEVTAPSREAFGVLIDTLGRTMFRTPVDDGSREARKALCMIHDARTVPYLVRALDSTDAELSWSAKATLEAYLTDRDPALRDEAKRQLAAHKPAAP